MKTRRLALLLPACLALASCNPPAPATPVDVAEGGGEAEALCDNSDGALDELGFIFVRSPRPGARVESGFLVRGCSRTFESNVPWRLLGRDGTELASGFTSGGGVDGPDEFSFSVDFDVSERQLGHLEVIEEDMSDGEGFPPPRNVIPLVLVP